MKAHLPLYRFTELSPAAQQAVLRQERLFREEYGLSEIVSDDLTTLIAEYHLPTEDIGWQLDDPNRANGVAVYGSVDVRAVLASWKELGRYRALLRQVDRVTVEIKNNNGHDWHGPRTMVVESEHDCDLTPKGQEQLQAFCTALEIALPSWSYHWQKAVERLQEDLLSEERMREWLAEAGMWYDLDGQVVTQEYVVTVPDTTIRHLTSGEERTLALPPLEALMQNWRQDYPYNADAPVLLEVRKDSATLSNWTVTL